MPTPTQAVVAKMRELLGGVDGLDFSIGKFQAGSASEPPFRVEQISTIQASSELRERAGKGATPLFQVYVEKVRNRMTEKFRQFSGTAQVVTEVRVSQDRLEGLTERLQLYADAVADVIERYRGDAGNGMYLTGQYEVSFEAIKKGGLHFQQTARVNCEMDVSR